MITKNIYIWVETQEQKYIVKRILEQAVNCEELWNINNGITLCKECHKKTDSYGGKTFQARILNNK